MPSAILFLMAIIVAIVSKAEGDDQIRCSEGLDEALTSMCPNGFNFKDLDGSRHNIRFRRLADVLRPKRESRKPFVGVADECCKHGCSYSQIKRYCLTIS